jgi:hypothetical protein
VVLCGCTSLFHQSNMWILHWYDWIWLKIMFFPKWIVWDHVANASSNGNVGFHPCLVFNWSGP